MSAAFAEGMAQAERKREFEEIYENWRRAREIIPISVCLKNPSAIEELARFLEGSSISEAPLPDAAPEAGVPSFAFRGSLKPFRYALGRASPAAILTYLRDKLRAIVEVRSPRLK
jgi:hypothetical protein